MMASLPKLAALTLAHLAHSEMSARRRIIPTPKVYRSESETAASRLAPPPGRHHVMSKELEYLKRRYMQHLSTLQTSFLTHSVAVEELGRMIFRADVYILTLSEAELSPPPPPPCLVRAG